MRLALPAGGRRPRGERRALPLSLQDILQHGAVQCQIGDQPLELAVLVFQLLEPSDFRPPHADELLLPAVERRLRDAHLPADLVHRGAILRLPQGEGDLFIREAFTRHGIHPPSGFRMPEKLALSADQFDRSGSGGSDG